MPKNLPELPSIRLLDYGSLALNDWNHFESIYPCWRLYWNQESGAWIDCGGRHPLGPDRLLLVPPFARVNLQNDAPIRHLFLCFELAPPWSNASRRVYTAFIGTETVLAASKLYVAAESNNFDANSILSSLLLICHGLNAIPNQDWLNNPVEPRIQRVLLQIEANLGQPLSSKQFADGICMTQNSFGRLFRKEVGTSPHRYILLRRLAMAGQLLRQGVEIEQAAQQCGFCDRYYFTRMFVQTFGVSPGRYRQRGTTATLSSLNTP